MNKKKLLTLSILLLFSLWLLFPRISKDWDIIEDDALLSGKDKYLNSLSRSSGSPNIIIIMADDLGRNDMALYDEVHGFQTPNLDALAESGVTFTDANASSPVCAPSRAGMLTGRIQNRYGFDSQPMQIYPTFPLLYYSFKYLVDTDEMHPVPLGTFPSKKEMEKQGVPQSELYLQEILKKAEYSTALIGKWHLGYGESQHPLNRGFDRFYGFLEAFTFFADPHDEGIVSYEHDLFWEKHIWNKKRKGPSAIQKDAVVIDEKRHLTDAITEESLEYIEAHLVENPDTPFFLYTAYNAPHTPFQELRKYYDMFPEIKDENRRVYAAMIRHLDDGIGELLQGLDNLGLRENTLIIFASDNGGASYTLATENGDLAGGKLSQFEGGLEIPMLMSWPRHIPQGVEYDKPVTLIDVYSTVLEAVNLKAPSDRTVDSVNLIPYVLGDIEEEPHEALFWKSGFNLSIRREGWKLMFNKNNGEYQLYNIKLDRAESQDLSSQYPEKAKQLLQEALELESQCKPAMWPRVMNFEVEVNGKKYLFAT